MKNRFTDQSFEAIEPSGFAMNSHLPEELVNRMAGAVKENPKVAFVAAVAVGLLLGFWLKEKK